MIPSALRDAAMRWIADDVDPGDRAELQAVLVGAMTGDAAAVDDLTDRMSGPLRFGTAGLRGPLRAGPNGMNRAVVVRTTAGLAAWLRETGREGTVVVGHDARHRSAEFARDAAGVLAAAGFDTVLLPSALPTPVLAFAVRRLGAVAGVQVTASHNPPRDNGYKLYVDGGTQVVPPTDRAVEAAIEAAPAAVAVPVADTWRTAGPALLAAYLDRVAGLARTPLAGLRVAVTPMHGVGGPALHEVLARAGCTDVHVVAAQAEPDPDFPTVAFPNPEEAGATDALLALAADVRADLAIALDPDADRCAVAVPDPRHGWRLLRGDETGVLLGDAVLARLDRTAHPDPLVATTIVSSSLLHAVAAARGARSDETLTGFKWLVRAGDGAGTGLVYAYEEALGHCVDPDAVRDKDGISAALLACDVAAEAARAGRTLLDLLDDLAVAHGVHRTEQVALRLRDAGAARAAVAALRGDPPAELAGTAVDAEDLLRRAHRPDDAVALRSEGLRVVVRPSGTEPKLKAYLEVVVPVASADGLAAARDDAERRIAALRDAVAALLAA